MDEKNRELLMEVISKKLNSALDADDGSESEKEALEQAVKAIDRQISISKTDETWNECNTKVEADTGRANEQLAFEKEKLEFEKEKFEFEKERVEAERSSKEQESARAKKEFWATLGVQVVSGVALQLVLNGLNNRFKWKFASECMKWENDGHGFTSSAGRSVAKDFFHFR